MSEHLRITMDEGTAFAHMCGLTVLGMLMRGEVAEAVDLAKDVAGSLAYSEVNQAALAFARQTAAAFAVANEAARSMGSDGDEILSLNSPEASA